MFAREVLPNKMKEISLTGQIIFVGSRFKEIRYQMYAEALGGSSLFCCIARNDPKNGLRPY
jgi:hypothetical protein